MKNKKALYTILSAIGIILSCAAVFILNDTAPKEVSGVCIGVGAGLFGLGAGQLATLLIMERHPETKRRIDIDARDERNMRINDMARAKAFGIMETIYGILALVLVLMGEPLLTVLLVIGAYVVGWGVYIGYLGKYQKEM